MMSPAAKHFVACALFLIATATTAFARYTLTKSEQDVVAGWLVAHPEFRRATARHCGCDYDIRNMRNGYGGTVAAAPDYDPYTVSGDFRGDGKDEIAVVIDIRKPKDAFAVVIFNGPFTSPAQPASIKTGLNLRRQGLFYGAPLAKPWLLVTGAFESEGGVFVPTGRTYRIEDY